MCVPSKTMRMGVSSALMATCHNGFSQVTKRYNFLYRSNRMASAVWNKLFDATLFKDDEGKP